ncbi:MAG: hypothetical protein ABR549_18415 [Mycobacteriales bacterium]
MVLFRELPSAEWLSAQRERGLFRAVAQFTSGTYEGMGLISDDEPHHVRVRDLQLEVRSLTPSRAITAVAAVMLPPLPGPLAHIPGDRYLVFALLKIRYGALEEYGNHAGSVQGDVVLASGVLLGNADHNLAIEVVGSDGDEVMRVVQALVDHAAVDSVEVLHTTAELTAGFGKAAD